MKKYLFPIFITFLGLFTAYAFYTLWHTEEVNPPKIPEHKKEKVIEELSDAPIVHKATLTVPDESSNTHSQQNDEQEMMIKEMKKQEDIPNLTPEQMEAQTQAVYETLTPENHEETMQEANDAFEALDAHVEELDAKLAQEEQDREESIDAEMQTHTEESLEEEIPTEETMEVPENEEEVDMEQEDVNNL